MHFYKGEILWMVMMMLMILGLSGMQIAAQQAQAQRLAQWQDTYIHTAWEVDAALSRYAKSPEQFPGGLSDSNEDLMKASLAIWQRFPRAVHETHASGIEVHVIMEAVPGSLRIFRLNALGYHPSGTLLKKQWVIACGQALCRQLSTYAI